MMKFVTQYLAPFMTGVSIAAATIAVGPVAVVALVAAACVFGYISFPPGSRLVRRIAGVPA